MRNGWIVAYVLRTKGSKGEDVDVDHYEVFIEDDAEKESLKRFDHLCNGGEFTKKKVEVYSVNRCQIVNSTEATYLNIL